MPTIPKRMRRGYKESKFWSTKVNPEGASIGNFLYNVKSLPGDVVNMVKKMGSAMKGRTGMGRKRNIDVAREEMMKK